MTKTKKKVTQGETRKDKKQKKRRRKLTRKKPKVPFLISVTKLQKGEKYTSVNHDFLERQDEITVWF